MNIEEMYFSSTLDIATGEYEVRYLNNKKKVVEIEKIYGCPYTFNSQVKCEINGEQVSPLISSNPMSDEIVSNNYLFTEDEKRISSVERIVLDIDYDYDTNIDRVLRILNLNFRIDLLNLLVYKTANNKIHIYINVDQCDYSTEEAILICKVIVNEINKALKQYDLEIDTTFVHNFGHYIFVEDFFLPLKSDKKSVLMYPIELKQEKLSKFPLKLIEDIYLNNKNEYLEKLKKDKYDKYNKNKEKASERRIDSVYLSYITEDISKIDDFLKNKKDVIKINRKNKIKDANIGKYFKTISEVSQRSVVGFSIDMLKHSKMYKDFLEVEKNELVAFYRYINEGISFLKRKIYKLSYYDHTYSIKKENKLSKDKYRFQRIIYPTVQTLVDVFGYSVTKKSEILGLVVDVFYAHFDCVDKVDFIDDVELALRYVNEDHCRDVDSDYVEMMSKKNVNNYTTMLKFLDDIVNNRIGIIEGDVCRISKKEIKETYNLNKQQFIRFVNLLEEYKKFKKIDFDNNTRDLVFKYVTHPYIIMFLEIMLKGKGNTSIGRYNINSGNFMVNSFKYFVKDNYDISVITDVFSNDVMAYMNIQLVKKRKKKINIDVLKSVYKYIDDLLKFFIKLIKKMDYYSSEKNVYLRALSSDEFFIVVIDKHINEIDELYDAVVNDDKLCIAYCCSFIYKKLTEDIVSDFIENIKNIDYSLDFHMSMLRTAYDKYSDFELKNIHQIM